MARVYLGEKKKEKKGFVGNTGLNEIIVDGFIRGWISSFFAYAVSESVRVI